MKRTQDKMQQLARLSAAASPRGRGRPPATEIVKPITMRLAPTVIKLIVREVARRKLADLPNSSIQAVVSEAVIEKLAKK